MDFLSLPKAHMHGCPSGTLNFAKLHLELKYLGNKPPAFAILSLKREEEERERKEGRETDK